jgi:hypothetical protein
MSPFKEKIQPITSDNGLEFGNHKINFNAGDTVQLKKLMRLGYLYLV